MGKEQERVDKTKRKIKTTNRLGTNVALKDRQHLYATESRSYQQNRALLMIPKMKSNVLPSSEPAPDFPLFPAGVLLVPEKDAVHEVPIQHSTTSEDLGTTVVDVMRQSDNVAADIALAMSAAPFAISSGIRDDGGGGKDDEQDPGNNYSSDYGGTDGNDSVSPSVNNIHDTVEGESADTNSDDMTTAYDGIHSDLFENLFQTVPVDSNKYRAPGTNINGLFGPLLLPDQDHPAALPALGAHVDDDIFLSQQYHHLTFEQRTDLLYLHWDILHAFSLLLEIKQWLESLSKNDHLLLLVQLYAACWVTTPVATLSFGITKARFWNAINNAGHFINGVFVVQHDVPLVCVTVESFIVRTVGQWVQYLARHELTVINIWDVLLEDVVDFATLDATVHPKYDVLLAALSLSIIVRTRIVLIRTLNLCYNGKCPYPIGRNSI